MKFYLVNGYIKFLTHKVTSTQRGRTIEQIFYDEGKKDSYIAYLTEKEIEYTVTEYPQPPTELLQRCEGRKFNTIQEARDFVDGVETVDNLKEQLADTDYKIIKSYEYQLAGLDLPYDMAALHTERQAIRDKINALEEVNANE